MQIKTFRAMTISDALQQVKKELGSNAVILGHKKVAASAAESYVEIVAAIEPDQPLSPKMQSALPAEMEIRDDIQEIKSLLSMLLCSKDYFAQFQDQQPLAEFYHSLIARGLDERQTFILLKKTLARLGDVSLSRRRIVPVFSQLLLEKVSFSAPFRSHLSARKRVFSFVGPTGVGKTTTLAKLAAYLKVKRQMRLGIVSLDTFRIGAIDQLKTYADILGAPMITAHNAEELQAAINEFRYEDVILVDTIGRNYLLRQHVAELQASLGGCRDMHHFLVLSATGKDEDLKQTIRHFHPLNVHSIIFTKVDETLSPGSMINQLLRSSLPVSYLGTGQRVPEDIEPASRKFLLSFLFTPEEDTHEKESYGA
jgi:flagellar biosynthesis protein FlhF